MPPCDSSKQVLSMCLELAQAKSHFQEVDGMTCRVRIKQRGYKQTCVEAADFWPVSQVREQTLGLFIYQHRGKLWRQD